MAANVALLAAVAIPAQGGGVRAQDGSYAPPPATSTKKHPDRNDAYSPPPDKQTYFPQMEAPADSGGRDGGGNTWSPPDRGFDTPYNSDGGGRSIPQNAVVRGALPTPVEGAHEAGPSQNFHSTPA